MNRRQFLAGTLSAGALTIVAAACSSESAPTSRTRGATAITRVFGDGQKLIAVAVEYDVDIESTSLSTASYSVPGRTITKVYTNSAPAVVASPVVGRYVIIEMSSTDSTALLWGDPQSTTRSSKTAAPQNQAQSGPPQGSSAKPVIRSAAATVTQTRAISTVSGTTYPASGNAVRTSASVDPLVDLFEQKSFSDPDNGQELKYNLFVPRNYSPTRSYPLVLFMHDASVVGADVKGPLVQGLGAVCWASPDDQARHECFVLAPQYDSVVVSDDYAPGPLFDTTVNLVHELTSRYSIDPKRLHATGQSMGAMMTLGMNIKHPDLFASSYVVAGQWPAEQSAPLARKRFWVTVSQGDTKAYPTENSIMGVLEQHGARVTRATWDGRASQQQLSTRVAEVTAHNTSINYVSFLAGTVPATGGGASEHMGTWRVAYSIPGIRDWVLAS